jgi:hypothetical protein
LKAPTCTQNGPLAVGAVGVVALVVVGRGGLGFVAAAVLDPSVGGVGVLPGLSVPAALPLASDEDGAGFDDGAAGFDGEAGAGAAGAGISVESFVSAAGLSPVGLSVPGPGVGAGVLAGGASGSFVITAVRGGGGGFIQSRT